MEEVAVGAAGGSYCSIDAPITSAGAAAVDAAATGAGVGVAAATGAGVGAATLPV